MFTVVTAAFPARFRPSDGATRVFPTTQLPAKLSLAMLGTFCPTVGLLWNVPATWMSRRGTVYVVRPLMWVRNGVWRSQNSRARRVGTGLGAVAFGAVGVVNSISGSLATISQSLADLRPVLKHHTRVKRRRRASTFTSIAL